MNSTILDEINAYYQKRGLKEPNALEALMWLISEIWELVEAYLKKYPLHADSEENNSILFYFEALRGVTGAIEILVSRRNGWVRNNQPKNTYDLPGEIADVIMMLAKFAEKCGLPEPEVCLREKMKRKLDENN